MLPVANRPFLDIVVRYLYCQGTRHFVFLTGYKGDQVEAYWAQHPLPHARFDFVHETVPLGTGGAVSTAIARHPVPGLMIVANGDSLVPFHLNTLVHAAQKHAGAVLAVETEDTARFGTLDIDPENTLIAFREKTGHPGPGLVNAGIYCLQPFLFESLPLNRPLSIEKDLFPGWIAAGASFKIIPVKGPLLDIGTPQSLASADEFIGNFEL